MKTTAHTPALANRGPVGRRKLAVSALLIAVMFGGALAPVVHQFQHGWASRLAAVNDSEACAHSPHDTGFEAATSSLDDVHCTQCKRSFEGCCEQPETAKRFRTLSESMPAPASLRRASLPSLLLIRGPPGRA